MPTNTSNKRAAEIFIGLDLEDVISSDIVEILHERISEALSQAWQEGVMAERMFQGVEAQRKSLLELPKDSEPVRDRPSNPSCHWQPFSTTTHPLGDS